MGDYDLEMQFFKKDVKRLKGVDVNAETIKGICAKHGVSCATKDKTPGNLPMLSVKMAATDPEKLRQSAKEIMQLYGKPELPSGLFAGASRKQAIDVIKPIWAEMA